MKEAVDVLTRELARFEKKLATAAERVFYALGANEREADGMKRVGEFWIPSVDSHFARFINQPEGPYQCAVVAAARARVRGWTTAVDVGAHVGLWASQIVDDFETVHLFEPTWISRACLARNLHASNVVIYGCALGARAGHCAMEGPMGGNTGDVRYRVRAEGVPVRTLDELGLKGVGLVKIDVQGDECAVLAGARKTLLRDRPVVVVEEHAGCQKAAGHALDSVSEAVAELGMTVFKRIGDDLVCGW